MLFPIITMFPAFQGGLVQGSAPMVRKNIPLWNYIHFPISAATSGTAFMEYQKIENLSNKHICINITINSYYY